MPYRGWEFRIDDILEAIDKIERYTEGRPAGLKGTTGKVNGPIEGFRYSNPCPPCEISLRNKRSLPRRFGKSYWGGFHWGVKKYVLDHA